MVCSWCLGEEGILTLASLIGEGFLKEVGSEVSKCCSKNAYNCLDWAKSFPCLRA